MRYHKDAIAHFMAIVLIIIILVAGIFSYALVRGYGSDGDYIPTLNLTLSTRSNGVIYDADIEMEVNNAKFVDYFFAPATIGSDHGFPKGEHKLEIYIFNEPISAQMSPGSTLFHEAYLVGNLYGYQEDGIQETKWNIELPMLKDIAPGDSGAFYLYVKVMADGATIGTKRITANPDAA